MTGTTGAKCLWITWLLSNLLRQLLWLSSSTKWRTEDQKVIWLEELDSHSGTADMELSQIPGQGSQEENKNNFISGPSQGETPDKQAGNLPYWIFSYLNQKSSIPFICFKKREKSSLSIIFLSWKIIQQPETGLHPTFLSGAGPVLYPGVSHALGSSLGNNRHADLHCEAGPGASCCSPGTG